MPSKSKQQQKFMGIVRAIQKGEAPAGKFSKAAQKAAKSMKKSSVRKYAKTKHDDLPKKVKEEKKRDYKAEYKKFQSSTKMKKYRAELNKYNRKKGTYGNGDGKDASHKGGKIVGFESQSKNRGRAEKSRLKKESIIAENPAVIATAVRKAMERAKERELSDVGGKKVKVGTALSNKKHPKHKQAKSIIQKIKDKAKDMLSKSKKKKSEPKKQSTPTTAADFRKMRKESIYEAVYKFKGMTASNMDELDADLSRENVKGTPDFNKMTYTIHRPKKDVYIDYYIKTKYKKFKPKRIKEGFGGELKGSQKKKFEKARKENAEQLGYKLTGKSDVNESVNERMDKRQAGETLKQLGGNRFIAMTGAKNFVVGPKGMGFKIGKNAKNVNYVRIDLDRGKDLYDMYFNFVSVRGVKVKSKVKGVYADQLRGMFTKHTGMYTSL